MARDRSSCAPDDHDYTKFDDSRIFCRKCGDQQVLVPGVRWYPYVPYPYWTPAPLLPAVPYWWTWPVTNGTITTTNDFTIDGAVDDSIETWQFSLTGGSDA